MSARISASTQLHSPLSSLPAPYPLSPITPLSPVAPYYSRKIDSSDQKRVGSCFLQVSADRLVEVFSHRKRVRNDRTFSRLSASAHVAFLTKIAERALAATHKLSSLNNWQGEFVRATTKEQIAIVQRTPNAHLSLIPVESLKKLLTEHLDLLDDRTAKRLALLYNMQELASLFAIIPMHLSRRFVELVRDQVCPSPSPTKQESLLISCCYPSLSGLELTQKQEHFQRIAHCSDDSLIYEALHHYIATCELDNPHAYLVTYLEHLPLACAERILRVFAQKKDEFLLIWVNYAIPCNSLFGYILRELPIDHQRYHLHERGLHLQEISRTMSMFNTKQLIDFIGAAPTCIALEDLQRQLPFFSDAQVIAISYCRDFDDLIRQLLPVISDTILVSYASCCPSREQLQTLIKLAIEKRAPSTLVSLLQGIHGQLTTTEITTQLESFFGDFLPLITRTMKHAAQEIDAYFAQASTFEATSASDQSQPTTQDTAHAIHQRWEMANLTARKFIELSHSYGEITRLNLVRFLRKSKRRIFLDHLESIKPSVAKVHRLCLHLWQAGAELQQKTVRSQSQAPTTLQWLEQLQPSPARALASSATALIPHDSAFSTASTEIPSEVSSAGFDSSDATQSTPVTSFGKGILNIYESLRSSLAEIGITPERLDELELSWEDLLEKGLRGENIAGHQITCESDLLAFLGAKKK